MKAWWATVMMSAALLLGACGSGENGGEVDCGSDQDCSACLSDSLPFWCYADRALDADDPDMCANITGYWGAETANVADECVNRIAQARKDCSLCSRISNEQIRSQCQQDCQ